MAIEITLPPVFRHLAGTRSAVEVRGATIGDCLDALAERYPVLREHIFSAPGLVRGGLAFYVNGEAAGKEPLSRAVAAGDTLSISQVVLGG